MEYIKPKRIWLKNNPDLNELWVQERIAEDPSILGLGDLILKDRERVQPRAGRLDLLLQDPDTNQRYEVEVQLGSSDESHIIRTIEYWDIERRRYPQYDHTAVIIAEDITSRFLNIISLFNGFIPLIALQMNMWKINDRVALMFTKVVDELPMGLIDEDEEVREVADRSYWENRGTKNTVAIADNLLEIIHHFDPGFELKYNKFYIGLAKNEQPNNFAIFRPQKNYLRFEVRLDSSEELEQKLSEAGLDVMEYSKRDHRYRVRLTEQDIKSHQELLSELLKVAYNNSVS